MSGRTYTGGAAPAVDHQRAHFAVQPILRGHPVDPQQRVLFGGSFEPQSAPDAGLPRLQRPRRQVPVGRLKLGPGQTVSNEIRDPATVVERLKRAQRLRPGRLRDQSDAEHERRQRQEPMTHAHKI